MVTVRRKPDFRKNAYEKAAWQQGRLICGVDEVGRGCLIGPVVAAAVIIHTRKISPLIRDSKQLTPEERLKSFAWIEKNCRYGIGIVHHRLIDTINIYQATVQAMKRAIMQLGTKKSDRPALIVVDAVPLTIDCFDGDIIAFTHGESKSVSIAAASVVAKVTRDRLMQRLDAVFPGYGLAQHKGYATREHRKSVEALNATIIHRTSFMHDGSDLQLNFFDNRAHDYFQDDSL